MFAVHIFSVFSLHRDAQQTSAGEFSGKGKYLVGQVLFTRSENRTLFATVPVSTRRRFDTSTRRRVDATYKGPLKGRFKGPFKGRIQPSEGSDGRDAEL